MSAAPDDDASSGVTASPLPAHLQVEVVTACNLACVTCPRTVQVAQADLGGRRAWWRFLPSWRLRELLAPFERLASVALHGIGEPLLHQEIAGLVAIAAERGARTRLTTNGTLLDATCARRLADAGLDRLIVSVDGTTAETFERIRVGARFASVCENVRRTTDAWRRGARRPRVDVAMVVSRANVHEAPGIASLARRLGADGVIVSPLIPASPEHRNAVCGADEWARAIAEIEAHAAREGLPLYLRGRPDADSGTMARGTHRCRQPWVGAVVLMSGQVMPCCNIHTGTWSMGDAFAHGFPAVWRGARYRRFRDEIARPDRVPEACRWCPEFR